MPSRMAGNKDSGSPPPDSCSTTRLQRNLAEKQRRDKLNGYISELATIVPMVSMASKRLDKTSILRLSAAHLRISQSFLNGNRKRTKNSIKWRPHFFNSDQVREILEAVEGFLLVTNSNGKIIYVSQSVDKFLGHQNIEMIGHSIFSFVHPSDVDTVRSQLQTLCLALGCKNGSIFPSARCSFYCRLRERNQPRSEVLTYQFVHIIGHMTPTTDEGFDIEANASKGSSTSSSSNLILKAFVRVVHSNPYNELSLADAVEDEYVTRHSPDGTIVFADHRLSTITGHLPHEVYGMSAYEYIREDDIPVALFAHKLMFSNNGGTGMIVYRLRTRNESYVYLKSTGYLQFEKSSSQVDHFVCVNKHLGDTEGEEELKKFIDRFTPHIGDTSSMSLLESLKNIQVETLVKIETKKSDEDDITVTLMDVDAENGSNSAKQKLTLSKGHMFSITNQGNVSQPSGQYSKRVSDKLSLETEVCGRMSVNCSPLTESSLSANSPQSEDIASPRNVGLLRMDSVFLNDTSSSSELMINDMTAEQLQGFVNGGDRLLCSANMLTVSPILDPVSSPSVDQVTTFIQSNSALTPDSPVVINEDALTDHTFWDGSPAPSALDGSEQCPLPTPPPSGEENGSKGVRSNSILC